MSSMKKILLEIKRLNRDDTLINLLDVEVKAAKMDSWISRLLPNAERRQLIRETKAALSSDHQRMKKLRQHQIDACSPSDKELFDALDDFSESLYTVAPLADQIKSRLRSYSNATLELMMLRFGGNGGTGIIDFTSPYLHQDEVSLREGLSFYGVLKDTETALRHSVLNDVRTSRKEFLAQDLSSLTEEEHSKAAAVMVVAVDVASRKDGKWSQLSGQLKFMKPHMTPEIAAVIVNHADRAYDIADYLKERGENLEDINTAHLLDYLNSPIRSLGGGVL